MRIHHLNCGSMGLIEPVDSHGLAPLPAVCHCLLIETEANGLVLVETGFGLQDTVSPAARLGADFVRWAQPRLDPAETAVRQVTRLGHRPEDVRHILVTHLHRDHTGGLADFPAAVVHVAQTEQSAALRDPAAPHAHWAHGPHWALYPTDSGDPWHGFDGVRQPDGLPDDILLIPLGGHSPGHTAIAVRSEAGWLLHAGDAYYFHGELHHDTPPVPPMLNALQEQTETDRGLRLANVARLQSLTRDPAAAIQIVSAHDPWEFRQHAGGVHSDGSAAQSSLRSLKLR
ncbi:MBL fold metallo-hydrolase [Streptomyces sp. WAC01490]|uniref:MBL fold metallo-hydrolase n=1 Tax=unclassified Streptomyces TaxID=2593676 RepID=UPI003F36B4EE